MQFQANREQGDGRGEVRLDRPPRILIVAPSFDILGGQSVQAARLISRLQEEPSIEIGFLPINPRLLSPFGQIKYLRTLITSLLYVTSLFAQVYKFDIIHVFSASYFSFILAPTPAILIGKLFRKRVLLNYHSGEAEDHLARWRTAITTIRLADEVAVPSEYLVRIFAQFGLRSIAIHNFIESDRFVFRARSPIRPRFLSIRNLESHYGVDLVLRAFAIIQKQVPEASLLVVGDGSQRRTLERLAEDLDLRNTKFTGKVNPDAIIKVYEGMDVFLNGSEIDNQPLSILEAFACGLPVVTTNAGGIPNIVTNERTGLIVPCGDYEGMAECALRLLRDPQLAETISEQARDECRRYSWYSVRQRWLELYYGLVNKVGAEPDQQGSLASQQNVVGR